MHQPVEQHALPSVAQDMNVEWAHVHVLSAQYLTAVQALHSMFVDRMVLHTKTNAS